MSEFGYSATGSEGSRIHISTLKPGQEDEPDDAVAAIQTAAFGVGYTVAKEKAPGWMFGAFRLAMDALQLLLLVVQPGYGWTGWIDNDNRAWQVFSFVGLNGFMAQRGYLFSLVTMYLMSGLLLVNIGVSAWVGWCFQSNTFGSVLPIIWLRWFGRVFYQVLDIASLSLFLIPISCVYYGGDPARLLYSTVFPDVVCWASMNAVHGAVATVSLAIFTVAALAFTGADMEGNPLSRNPLATAHTGVEILTCGLRTVMTVANALINDGRHLGVVYLVCACLMTWLYAYWVPHLYPVVNHVRVGSCTMVTYASLLLLIMSVRDAEIMDSGISMAFRQSMTTAMWVGLIPAGLLGALLSWTRLRWFDSILEQLRCLTSESESRLVIKLVDAREVEILGRCCRQWDPVTEEVIPEAVQLAEFVMKVGMHQLPSSPYMVLLCSAQLMDVRGSYQSGYSLLQSAKKLQPSLLECFAVFAREQQHAQSHTVQGGMQSGGAADLITYVEFQRNLRLVIKDHKQALVNIRTFWSLLLHQHVNVQALSTAVDKLALSIKDAERTYRTVLARHTTSVRIVWLYGKFMERVKNDPWAASKWLAEAERLEQDEEEAKQTSAFADMSGLDPALRNALTGQLGLGTDTRAVIFINAHSIITMANQYAHDLLGYGKGQLAGKNVNIIVPRPFAELHNSYVRQYVATGLKHVLDHGNEICALHKEQHTVSVTLTVTQVSGIGEDSQFLGVLEEVPTAPHTAVMHVLSNSSVISVDTTFSDWSGFTVDDVSGMALSELVVNWTDVAGCLKEPPGHPAVKEQTLKSPSTQLSHLARRSSIQAVMSAVSGMVHDGAVRPVSRAASRVAQHAPIMGNTWYVAGVILRHKYASAFPVNVECKTRHMGQHVYRVLTVMRAPEPETAHPTAWPGLNSSPGWAFGTREPAGEQLSNFVLAKARLASNEATDSHLVQPSRAATQPNASGAADIVCTDRKGKVLHITQGLAQALGLSIQTLLTSNNSLESLLPPPFAQLHRVLAMNVPHYLPPPYSCRSGLAQLLLAQRAESPSLVAYKMTMRKHLHDALGGNTDGYHVTDMVACSAEQALAERCLSLKVDVRTGRIVRAGLSPNALFQLQPQALVGQDLSSLLDMALASERPEPAHMATMEKLAKPNHPPGTPGPGNLPHLATLLTCLADRSRSAPSAAYRAGVLTPTTGPVAALMTVQEVQSVTYSYSTAAVPGGSRAVHPQDKQADTQVLTLAAPHRPQKGLQLCISPSLPHSPLPGLLQPADDDVLTLSPVSDGIGLCSSGLLQVHSTTSIGMTCATSPLLAAPLTSPPPPSLPSSPGPAKPSRSALPVPDDGVPVLLSPGHDQWSVQTAKPPRSGFQPSQRLLHLQLWRQDLCCSVVDVDMAGIVVPSLHNMSLYPAGLLFGVPASVMIGLHISVFLPQLTVLSPGDLVKGSPVATGLLEQLQYGPAGLVPAAALAQGLAASKRSALKGGLTKGDIQQQIRVGAVYLMTGHCYGDGMPIDLAVQAVVRAEGGQYLVVHPYVPRLGRTDLLTWLQSQQAANAARSSLGRPMPADKAPLLSAVPSSKQAGHPCITAALDLYAVFTPAAETKAPQSPTGRRKAVPIPFCDHMNGAGQVVQEGAEAISSVDRNTGVRFGAQAVQACPAPAELLPMRYPHALAHRAVTGKERVAQWVSQSDSLQLSEARNPEGKDIGQDMSDGNGSADAYDLDATTDSEMLERGSAQGALPHLGVPGSAEEPSADHDAVPTTDYRRGQRLKRLTRMLQSAAVQANVQQYRLHVFGIVLLLVAAHTSVFAMIYSQAIEQEGGVRQLQHVGLALDETGEAALAVLQLKMIYSNVAAIDTAGLSGLQNNAASVAATLYDLRQALDNFKDNLQTFYLEEGPVPEENGLVDVWESPGFSMLTWTELPMPEDNTTWAQYTVRKSVPPGIAGNNSIYHPAMGEPVVLVCQNTSVSMWTFANKLLEQAELVWRMAELKNASGWNLQSWAPCRFVLDNVFGDLNLGFTTTMDGLVSVVADDSVSLNEVQTLCLGLEGALLTVLAAAWVWVVTGKLVHQRWLCYNIFLAVPTGLVRGLATQQLSLEENEEDEDTYMDMPGAAGAAGDPGAAGAFSLAGVVPTSAVNLPNLSVKGATSGLLSKADGACSKQLNRAGTVGLSSSGGSPKQPELSFWHKVSARLVGGYGTVKAALGLSRRIHPSPLLTKRLLKHSYMDQVRMCSPIVLCGVIMVIISSVGINTLATVQNPAAMFTMVNLVNSDAKMAAFWLQGICLSDQVDQARFQRDQLGTALSQLQDEYNAVVYGGTSVPGHDGDDRYTLAEPGLSQVAGTGLNLLFYTQGCLRFNTSTCLTESSIYYPDVSQGINRMMQRFISVAQGALLQSGSQPYMNGSEMDFVWNTREDLRDSLLRLNTADQQVMLAVYTSLTQTYIVGLVLHYIILAAFLLLVYRPYLRKCAAEAKSIAELLSQLPPDIDVEGLVQRQFLQALEGLRAVPVIAGPTTALKRSSSTALGSFAAPPGACR